MPRGVPIPGLRQELFAALERVVVADGAARLSGRAVTREAGVAVGVLYTHFADLEEFLLAYAVDRAFQIASGVGKLTESAGTATVEEHLTAALLATDLTSVQVLTRLTIARPDLPERIRGVLGTAGLDAVERAISGYLQAERRLGRVSQETDSEAVSLALVGLLHKVVLSGPTERTVRRRVRRAVRGLTATFAARQGNRR